MVGGHTIFISVYFIVVFLYHIQCLIIIPYFISYFTNILVTKMHVFSDCHEVIFCYEGFLYLGQINSWNGIRMLKTYARLNPVDSLFKVKISVTFNSLQLYTY